MTSRCPGCDRLFNPPEDESMYVRLGYDNGLDDIADHETYVCDECAKKIRKLCGASEPYVRCDQEDCPGHESPEERPCYYEPKCIPCGDTGKIMTARIPGGLPCPMCVKEKEEEAPRRVCTCQAHLPGSGVCESCKLPYGPRIRCEECGRELQILRAKFSP